MPQSRGMEADDAAQLGEIVARVDAGDLKIDVAQRRPLTDLRAGSGRIVR